MPEELMPLEPLKISRDLMLVVCFQRSTSKSFPVALSLAQQASHFERGVLGESPMYAAGFKMTKEDAGVASALLKYVAKWAGTLVFANGRLISYSYELMTVLDCYMNAEMCRDPRAHCERIVDDPAYQAARRSNFSININPSAIIDVQVKRYAFPCRNLHHTFNFQPNHPASYADQIHAAGIESMCNLCPRFNPDAFREVGIAVYQVGVD